VLGLLAVEVFLLLSDYFRWFPLNEHKGWTVLLSLAVQVLALVALVVWFLASRVLHRQFQFGLRTLLLFVVMCAIVCSWMTVEMQAARRQRVAVEWVERSGGWVFYGDDYSGDAGPLDPPPGSVLHDVLGRDFFCEVRDVSLATTKTADDMLPQLGALPELRSLDLDDNQITDDGLKHLRVHTGLEELCLGGADITDDGLKHLQGFARLRHLALVGTDITDLGLEHLQGFDTLECLQLYYTNVTPKGVRALQSKLPNCRILHGVPPPDSNPGVF
jgi:hypothetical protein